jgi:signal transduction histidine kinase
MTEARARQLERVDSLGSVAGGIAHDFNNLIGAINAFTEMAKDGLDGATTPEEKAQVRADLDEVLKVTGRAQGLVAQLLTFSKGTTSDPRRVDVAAAVQDLAPMLQRLLGSRITLEVLLEPGVPTVWIDPSQLTQALLNLVVNARDAMHDRGRLAIRLAQLEAGAPRSAEGPAGAWVLLQVRDSGSGMTDEVRRRLFEPYFTTKGEGKGTGLGLPVVQASVRSAGGHIDVDSVVGEGTTFWIYLPPHTA